MNQVHPISSRLLVLILTAGLVLAACGTDEDTSVPPSIVITIQAEPVGTVLPGCETAALESWYEVAGTLINTFNQESKAALDFKPAQLPSVIDRLTVLRNAVGEHPAPQCAVTVHDLILLHMRVILSAFQQYANGDLSHDDLRSQVNAASREIETGVATLLARTQVGLEQQLQDQRATQQAPASP